jgi:hypothetical protein
VDRREEERGRDAAVGVGGDGWGARARQREEVAAAHGVIVGHGEQGREVRGPVRLGFMEGFKYRVVRLVPAARPGAVEGTNRRAKRDGARRRKWKDAWKKNSRVSYVVLALSGSCLAGLHVLLTT